MKPNPNEPADTTMMTVVHDALRRDLQRFKVLLGTGATPNGDSRRALAVHAEWMMAFLEAHHRGEDAGLWPLVRRCDPGAAGLLDQLEAEHAAVSPVAARVADAARRDRRHPTAGSWADLSAALLELSDVLVPHLNREIDQAMPIVSACLTNADWDRWEHEHNLDGQSIGELARRAHWLMDGLDPARYRKLVHLVPAVPRFVIVHGFARSYRHAGARRWGADVPCGPASDRARVRFNG